MVGQCRPSLHQTSSYQIPPLDVNIWYRLALLLLVPSPDNKHHLGLALQVSYEECRLDPQPSPAELTPTQYIATVGHFRLVRSIYESSFFLTDTCFEL